jgi:hypothetical protein
LGLKTGRSGLVIWASKSSGSFLVLASKLSRIRFVGCAKNRWREVGVRHVSRSSGLLCVKASQATVSQSGLKTGGSATTGGARGTIIEVTSESS